MKILETHIVPPLQNRTRLSDYAVGIFNSIPTKSSIKKALKKELILVNNQIGLSGQFMIGGENIQLLQDDTLAKKNIFLKLDVLWEDEYLAVVFKPAGLLISGNKAKTVTNALAYNLKKSTLPDAVKPQPVHRLDFATSGLLLIGKTANSIRELSKLFENKNIHKTYVAVTIGNMHNNGTIDVAIDEKKSISSYQVLKTIVSKKFEKLNLVQLTPHTGRRHQLRIHCAHLKNPILGDATYGISDKILRGKGLYLHAQSLTFIHPYTQEKLSINRENPKKFNKIFE